MPRCDCSIAGWPRLLVNLGVRSTQESPRRTPDAKVRLLYCRVAQVARQPGRAKHVRVPEENARCQGATALLALVMLSRPSHHSLQCLSRRPENR
ncbi:hypothetical protein Pan216_48800 [Planctomycetes bacterium Pan216]|uniref:Uncharacterized protein n=1 Tax=Kolteria novifilia TaxID=2527975 RepID=A0A518BAJ3_9BACT|nr:hypothetical protein Pan216_48800 [Planctomycetes bacterium Pan216]